MLKKPKGKCIHFAMVRSRQQGHVTKKNFHCKILFGQKNLKESQQKSTSMQIHIVRHDNFLSARYKIRLKSPYVVYLRRHFKLIYQLQNCRHNGVRKASR